MEAAPWKQDIEDIDKFERMQYLINDDMDSVSVDDRFQEDEIIVKKPNKKSKKKDKSWTRSKSKNRDKSKSKHKHKKEKKKIRDLDEED